MKKLYIICLMALSVQVAVGQRAAFENKMDFLKNQELRTNSNPSQSARQIPVRTLNHLASAKGFMNLSTAAIIYSDNFDGLNDTTSLQARGYHVFYRGTGPQGTTATWFQGNPTVFNAYNGPTDGYVAANYNAVTGLNDIDNWLITPAMNVMTGDTISFYSQSPAASTFPDSITVMYSAAGDSVPEAMSWVSLGSFKVNILGMWEQNFFQAPAAGSMARFAIRYKVSDAGPLGNNSDYIGIDQLDVFEAGTSGGGGGSNVPPNNACSGAIDINSAFGGAVGAAMTMGPYNNDSATVDPTDPTFGWECFGEPNGSGTAPSLENTLWYTFTGDGDIYFIETSNCGGPLPNEIDDGDTQIAVYEGSCGSLVAVGCNEDGPSATAVYYPAGLNVTTVNGTQYYVMIDGFNFSGAISNGQYCIEVTRLNTIQCLDSSITSGTLTQNADTICPGDTLIVTATGAVAPNVGQYNGISWTISSADLMGTSDPLNDPALVATYTFTSPVPAASTRQLINNGALIGNGTIPYGMYYWSPVLFGNGFAATPPTFLSDITLDPACTTTGTSLAAYIAGPGDPACVVGVNEISNSTFGISNVYPVPAESNLSFTLFTKFNSQVEIRVLDNLGRLISTQVNTLTNGHNVLSLDVNDLSSGVYMLNISDAQNTATVKFLKK